VLARNSLLTAWAILMSSAPINEANSAPSARGLLLVANQMEHTVLVVDPESRRELAKVVVGVNGHEVVVSKDGRFGYVPIYGNSGVGRPGTDGRTIDVIDLKEHKLAAAIDLGKPLRPHCAEFGLGGLLYVTAELANAVEVIDPPSGKVLGEIPSPWMDCVCSPTIKMRLGSPS
jgi:DNA-binding beta-propeller fold protein YncE